MTIFLFPLVPSIPETLTVMTVDNLPMKLQVSWDPPNEPNGRITSYTVYCYKSCTEYEANSNSDGQNLIETVIPGNQNETLVEGLRPYTIYNCSVTANTSVGEGSSSITVSARTDESSKANICSHYISSIFIVKLS